MIQMILILSTPRDLDTQEVIDWLVQRNASFLRLNDEDLMDGTIQFHYNPKERDKSFLKKKDEIYAFSNIKVVWFRKFGFLKTYEENLGKTNDVIKYLYSEFRVLSSLILDLLDDKKWLFRRTNMPTKMKVLEIAYACGLNIPETIITTSKIELDKFFRKNNNSLISKSLGEGKHMEWKDRTYPFFTQKIESIDIVSEKFSPSLFQKRIVKKYELRIFYLDGQIFPMVIFSQNNPKTVNDFRNYDTENPNRYEPYRLPELIERGIVDLMAKVGLNTGSIDMIRATDDEYYFLEINPSGQFGMTAIPCNYPLHDLIAKYLIKNSY